MPTSSIKRVEITVQGIVQGVGFRPFVYRLAKGLGLFGTIINTDHGVVVDLEGKNKGLIDFLKVLRSDPPPLARISSIAHRPISFLQGFTECRILTSISKKKSSTLIPADIATCEECLQECLDPRNRRFHYPFTNCTNCGPRFTIVETTPYDRSDTSMKHFPLCVECREEYEQPEDRRFHAQPNACANCGPEVSFHDAAGVRVGVLSPLTAAAKALAEGQIVAMRGLGGFHLVVDASSESGVQKLRKRKGRKSKPLAVMTASLIEAGRHGYISPEAKTALQSVQHPIVLLPARQSNLAPSLVPGTDEIGVMLPYTPLHHLLFQQAVCPQTLVMTSGNKGGFPIFTANDAAVDGLRGIADFFLLHNREIVTRVDDSLLRCNRQGLQLLRRARGYVPGSVTLFRSFPELLACGASLKSTFCLTRGKEAFVSQHIGSLVNLESLDFYRESIYHLQKLLQVTPEAVVCDLHPDYLSTQYAVSQDLPLYRVQHHHAHAVAVMAEHGIEEKVLALILDGSGLGDDNTLWGGEVLEADCRQYKRLASLDSMLLPGGDAAAEAPWRMGLSLLHNGNIASCKAPALESIDKIKRQVLTQMMEQKFNCPVTTSCGRLFDGIAALLGVCLEMDYEGQAAMELESLAIRAMGKEPLEHCLEKEGLCAAIIERDNRLIVKQNDLVVHVLQQLSAGVSPAAIALGFHLSLIRSFAALLGELSKTTGLKTVVLGGGCMQNRLLLQGLFHILQKDGFMVYSGEQIPVNDGGISLGQTIIGGLAHVLGSTDESS